MDGSWYTSKQFLFTFRFQDKPLHVPALFLKDEDSFPKLCKDIGKCISRGMRIEKAFAACGIQSRTYDEWLKNYREEVSAGLVDTPLIRLFNTVYTADANLDLTLHDLAMDRVLDGDEKMLHFLMKHRLGYNTQRTELELSNTADTPFTINIVGMTDESKVNPPISPKDVMEGINRKIQNQNKDDGEEYKSIFDENGELIKD